MGPESDRLLPKWRNEIRVRFENKKTPDLHFRTLNHEQKVFTCQSIASQDIALAFTISDKSTIAGGRYEKLFKSKGYLYNYLVRWLLERLVSACKAASDEKLCSLRVVFSRRAGTDYASMKSYLAKLALGQDVYKAPRTTDWSVLDIGGIEVENHSKRAGLQLVDCATSAIFAGLEPDAFGNIESRYGLLLRDKLIRTGTGLAYNAGLTVVPNFPGRCTAEQAAFVRAVTAVSGQAPGP